MLFGLFVILIGFVFLLKNLGIITGSIWGIIWPSVLIIFGAYLVFKTHRLKLFCRRVQSKVDRLRGRIASKSDS